MVRSGYTIVTGGARRRAVMLWQLQVVSVLTYSFYDCCFPMFLDISSSFYTIATVSLVSSVYNIFVMMLSIMLFNDIKEVIIKVLLLVRIIIILMINLASIFNMIINSEFIVVIPF